MTTSMPTAVKVTLENAGVIEATLLDADRNPIDTRSWDYGESDAWTDMLADLPAWAQSHGLSMLPIGRDDAATYLFKLTSYDYVWIDLTIAA